MKLLREEYIAICQQCKNSVFDKNKGVVCSLTKEHANFDDKCSDFLEDEIAIKRAKRVHDYMNDSERDSFDSVDSANRTTFKSGIAFLGIGTVLLIVGGSFGLVMLFSVILILAGLVFVVIAIIGKVNDSNNKIISSKSKKTAHKPDQEIY